MMRMIDVIHNKNNYQSNEKAIDFHSKILFILLDLIICDCQSFCEITYFLTIMQSILMSCPSFRCFYSRFDIRLKSSQVTLT